MSLIPNQRPREALRLEDIHALAQGLSFTASAIHKNHLEFATLTQDLGGGHRWEVQIAQSELGLYPTALSVTTSRISPAGADQTKHTVSVDNIRAAAEAIRRHMRAIDLQVRYGCEFFVNTHIRIHTPAYRHEDRPYNQMLCFDTPEQNKAFNDEVEALLRGIGFERLSSYLVRGMEHLYVHPDDLSGELREGTLQQVLGVLANAKLFRLRAVDEYEMKPLVQAHEFREILEANLPAIKQDLLKRLTTTRRSSFYPIEQVTINAGSIVEPMLADPRRLFGSGERYPQYSPARFSQVHSEVTKMAIDQLVQSGEVLRIEEEKGVFVRTRNKTEMAEFQRAKRKAARLAKAEAVVS